MTNKQLFWRIVGVILSIVFLPWLFPLFILFGVLCLVMNAASDDVWGGKR